MLNGNEEVVDVWAREQVRRALEGGARNWEGIANVVREIASLRAWMEERFDQLETRMRRRMASVSDIARESAEDVVRTGRHNIVPPPAHTMRSSIPPKIREGFKAMVGGGVLNLIWVALGAIVSILIQQWIRSLTHT